MKIFNWWRSKSIVACCAICAFFTIILRWVRIIVIVFWIMQENSLNNRIEKKTNSFVERHLFELRSESQQTQIDLQDRANKLRIVIDTKQVNQCKVKITICTENQECLSFESRIRFFYFLDFQPTKKLSCLEHFNYNAYSRKHISFNFGVLLEDCTTQQTRLCEIILPTCNSSFDCIICLWIEFFFLKQRSNEVFWKISGL